jgi:hypothetical protein
MPKRRFETGGIVFESQKEYINYIRAMITRSKIAQPLTPRDAQIARSILERHPQRDEKIRRRIISHFETGLNNGSKCLFVVFKSGDREHFSYKKSLGLK